MAIDMLYFAWVREGIGTGAERVDPPAEVATVADLIGWLATRSAGHAAAFADPAQIRAAIDDRFADPDSAIAGAREVALFPPVTGLTMAAVEVRVQAGDFDPGAELAVLERLGGGGVASFTGLVRGGGGLTALVLEHHPGMTARAMQAIAATALARWPLLGVTLVHRHGALAPGARIVFVGAASPHRAAALEATMFLIDWLKTRAPFWKQERYADGHSTWVAARVEDDAAANRWDGADG